MIVQPALGEFALDVGMGIHFFLHTPKAFLACRVRQLFAHFTPETPDEIECQRFLQAYGLRLEKPRESADAGLTRIAIRYLQGHGWDLFDPGSELDPWSGRMVTLRRRATWPAAEATGWETCSVHSSRGTGGPNLVLERQGRKFRCDLELIYTDAELTGEADRRRQELLAAYGWLTNRVTATRDFIGAPNTPSTPARLIPLHYLICLLLRQGWEPIAYGPEHFGPLPWRVTFRRPVPASETGSAVEGPWKEALT